MTGQDSYGQDTITYSAFWAGRAKIEALKGREFQTVQQRWADARLRIELRSYVSGVKREMRIIWGTRTLDILDAEDPDGTRRTLLMYCKELVS